MFFPLINICGALGIVETRALRARVSTTPHAPQMLINGKTMFDPAIGTQLNNSVSSSGFLVCFGGLRTLLSSGRVNVICLIWELNPSRTWCGWFQLYCLLKSKLSSMVEEEGVVWNRPSLLNLRPQLAFKYRDQTWFSHWSTFAEYEGLLKHEPDVWSLFLHNSS